MSERFDSPDAPLSAADVDEALAALLAQHPEAEVAAVGPDGLFVDMPASVPAHDHPPLAARAGIELVSADDRSAVLQQFLEIGEVGASTLDVITRDGQAALYYLFDCTSTHGVVVLVLIRSGERVEVPVSLPDAGPVRPRYARIWRTEIAEVIRIEPAVTQMMGNTLEDYRAHPASEFIHPDDQERSILNWFDVIGSPPGSSRRWRGRSKRADGSWLWVEFTNTNHLDEPHDPHVLTEMVDISEEMRATEEAWESRAVLRRLTEALPLAVVLLGADGTVEYANARLFELFGVAKDADPFELVDKVVESDRDALRRAVLGALAGDPDLDVEVRFDRPGDGDDGVLAVAVRSVRGRDGTVSGAIVTLDDVTEATRMRQELVEKATVDALTGCVNRASILAELERVVRQVGDGSGAAVIYADLDGFKEINDRDGHAVGDEVLRVTAARLRGAVRSRDLVGRMGGDEFVILCPDLRSPELAMEVAERVVAAVAEPIPSAGLDRPLVISVGVAWTDTSDTAVDALVALADAAMYRAKRDGCGRPVLSGRL